MMTLAAVLALYFVSLAAPSPGYAFELHESAAQGSGSASASPAATPSAQSTNPAPATSSDQQQNPPNTAKPSTQHRRHRKKTPVPDCSNSAAPLKTPGDGASSQAASSQSGPATATAPAPKPCPPPKVVIKNGGSNEPTVELKGKTTAEQASQPRYTTEQLTAATEENLKKIEGRKLDANQQQMVSQIKEFMEQSKKAIGDGDPERGHNLASKAQLLSNELVKP